MRSTRCTIGVAAALMTVWSCTGHHATAERKATARSADLAASGGPGAAHDVVRFAGGTIQIEFDASHFRLSREELARWVTDSARATAAYFGRFPVPFVRLVIEPTHGAEVTMGRAVGRPEASIVVTMGRLTTATELAGESLLVHEMAHLAVPDHDIRHLWLHEGIATYVEHVARAQAGLVTPREMWGELFRELPAGQPARNETGGLDGTPSDNRRYWGGALFCLLADVEIRKATGNRLGLQDALRALQRKGGSLARMWTLEQTIDTADSGTGTAAFAHLYRLMGLRAHAPDLAGLWRDLGVVVVAGQVRLDDRAPLASVRRAITDRPSAPLLVAAPRLLRVVEARAPRSAR
jgi:hypothetical protein